LNVIEQVLASEANSAVNTVPAPPKGFFATARRMFSMGAATLKSLGARSPPPRPFVLPQGYAPFSVGPLGNFPYYWQDPSSFKFNAATYQWVSAGLAAASDPVQHDGYFTNRYLQALSKITYALSTADQAILNHEHARTKNQQLALMVAWKNALGSVPSDNMNTPAISLIMEEITSNWASPATDLHAILHAGDRSKLLNTVPAAGLPVLPHLTEYLSVLSASLPLLSSVTKNNALLKKAMRALQAPNLANGALETNRNELLPAFEMQTPVSDILKGLAATVEDKTVTLKLSMAPRSDGNLDVTVNQGQSVKIPAQQILSVNKDGDADPLSAALSKTGSASTITAKFIGATPVFFAPAEFSLQTLKNWFWADPIIEACHNGNADVTGFRFALDVDTDFSENGNFGFLKSVIISRVPSITVETTSEHAARLRQAVDANDGKALNFLGRDMGALGADDGYQAKDDGAAGNTVTLQPVVPHAAGGIVTSRAFVLGAQTYFPIADAVTGMP
jgi:hypothetical protein